MGSASEQLAGRDRELGSDDGATQGKRHELLDLAVTKTPNTSPGRRPAADVNNAPAVKLPNEAECDDDRNKKKRFGGSRHWRSASCAGGAQGAGGAASPRPPAMAEYTTPVKLASRRSSTRRCRVARKTLDETEADPKRVSR